MSDWFRRDGNDLLLFLRVQPRAGRNAFGEILEERRKLYLKAPPVDGKANQELVRFLSKALRVPKGRIVLESGETGRNKRIRIKDFTEVPADW
jgi:uncharacterized protein (TIGR00251 family)